MEGLIAQREIAEEMKRVADNYPWVPLLAPPPRRHYRTVGELQLCFTLDLLPGGRSFYHLSITKEDLRVPPSDEEARGWCAAFFGDVQPFEFPSWLAPGVPCWLAGVPSRHFFWGVSQIVLS